MKTAYADRIMDDPSKNCLRVNVERRKLGNLVAENEPHRLRGGGSLGKKLLAELLKDACGPYDCTVRVKRGKGCDAFARLKFPDVMIGCIFGVSHQVSEVELVIILDVFRQGFWEKRKTPSEVPEIALVRDGINAAIIKHFGVSTIGWMDRKEFERRSAHI